MEGGWRGPPGAGGPSLIWGPGQFSGVWQQVLSDGPVPACDVTPGLLGGEVQKWGLLQARDVFQGRCSIVRRRSWRGPVVAGNLSVEGSGEVLQVQGC